MSNATVIWGLVKPLMYTALFLAYCTEIYWLYRTMLLQNNFGSKVVNTNLSLVWKVLIFWFIYNLPSLTIVVKLDIDSFSDNATKLDALFPLRWPKLSIALQCTLHRGAFCQFPFQLIYYCHVVFKSAGKETVKNAPLCTDAFRQFFRLVWFHETYFRCPLFDRFCAIQDGKSDYDIINKG